MPEMKALIATLPQVGRVTWIGVRPERRGPVREVDAVEVSAESGLAGDHYRGRSRARQVTLIQGEHLDAVASMLGVDGLDPGEIRRNIVVRGLNLLALKDRTFRVGSAVLQFTALCHPCSLMEEQLGPGGYNAMRGHGGITARVVEGGTIRIGDDVAAADSPR